MREYTLIFSVAGIKGVKKGLLTKTSLGLLISGLGLGITLIPTLIYMAVAEQGIGPLLSQEIFPEVPLYLVLAICGAPVTISGLVIFRGGIKEMIKQAEMQAQLSGVEIAEPSLHNEETFMPTNAGSMPHLPEVYENLEQKSNQLIKENMSSIRVRTAGTTVVCLMCGETLPLGSTSCTKCGAKLEVSSEPEKACPVCGGDLTRAAKLGDNIYICGICFSELEIPPERASKIFK